MNIKYKEAEKIFAHWNETMILSCLDGTMGEIFTNEPINDAAMAILGDFVFFAGKPSKELIKFKPKTCKKNRIIMVPENEEWADLIKEVYQEQAIKIKRYAIKKEKNVFDREKLEQILMDLDPDYEMKLIEEKEFMMCKENDWSQDLVSLFDDYKTYATLGLGVVILHNKEIVAGASSYSRYKDGIEIQINTRVDYRRKGLASACGAKLILECLDRNLYPSWDAQNLGSVALAEKLGYHFSHEYMAYGIKNY